MGGCGLDSSGSLFGQVAGSCEYGNEPSRPENFLIAEELLAFRKLGRTEGGGVWWAVPPHVTHRSSINTGFVDWVMSDFT